MSDLLYCRACDRGHHSACTGEIHGGQYCQCVTQECSGHPETEYRLASSGGAVTPWKESTREAMVEAAESRARTYPTAYWTIERRHWGGDPLPVGGRMGT